MRKFCLVFIATVLAVLAGERLMAATPVERPGQLSMEGVLLPQDGRAQPAPVPQSPQESRQPDQVQAVPPAPVIQCGTPISPPRNLPPAGSGPVVYTLSLCFARQGGTSVIEPQTYLYYAQLRPSRPSENVWTPYNEATEKTMQDDFRRLWATNFLDDLSIEVADYVFPNGVVGKLVTYNMEERQRVKIVEYTGTKNLEQTKIDEKLKESGSQIRLDSFLNPSLIQKVESVIRDMLAEKGYQFAEVTHKTTPLQGGSKLVNLTFTIQDGPKVRIGNVEFVGNKAASSGKLGKQMKSNKAEWFLSFITGRGTYQAAKYEEDADKIIEYYRDRGYIDARVGEPDLKFIEDSKDKKTRYVQLRIPIFEGQRYRVGNFAFDGNKVVKTEALRELFKVKTGDYYSDKVIKKALEKAREIYGSVGYFEFTAYPDLRPRTEEAAKAEGTGASTDAGAGNNGRAAATGGASATTSAARPAAGPGQGSRRPAPAIVDVTMKLQEGKQYFINRITFVGNTNTRDNVVRRELRLFEGGVFNTEALKYSIKRLNQLAYFKPLEGGKDVDIQKTPGADNKVDVTLKFEEQNRNQITFGAGVSQYEGFFGQLAFQTSNFMGRGETFSVMLQAGQYAQNYQVGFSEPFLFDRPITGGVDLFKRRVVYINQFTQSSTGGNVVFGFPLRDFTRMFLNYSYEHTRVIDVNPIYTDPLVLASNPYLADSLLLGANGARTISKIVPSVVYNTVDNPIFPSSGRRFTASVDLAGLGGDTNFYKPMLEAVWYIPQTRRLTVGLRAQWQYIAPFTGVSSLPFFERLFLGGEYSVRGYDIRTIGPKAAPTVMPPSYNGLYFLPGFVPVEMSLEPTVTNSLLVIGGNKSLLFNAEYQISIMDQVRLIFFYDAGEVLDTGRRFTFKDFKTSTGTEVRFFMPVLNVPFRLIFAYNPNRSGVYDNNLQPAKAFSFKFAVGSTF
jgi:outer membrane protein insertion porin family